MIRKIIGLISASIVALTCVYMILGTLALVPMLDIHIFNESLLRVLAQVAVLGCLICAWAFWEI